MSFYINNTELQSAYYNGSEVSSIYYNGTLVWEVYKWEWGSETAVGDAEWWANLKAWAATASTTERAACVGKVKYMDLSTAVLGCTRVAMICIGADRDGTGTLTFQTRGVLPTAATFGSSIYWIGSNARTQCQNFYNYCAAKNSIKTVSKGTCASRNGSRAGTATYNDETVWIPSEREMGLDSYAAISVANSTTTNAECTYGKNAAYNYYNSNSRRIKYVMSSTGALTTTTANYWNRSVYYSTVNSFVCTTNTSGAAYRQTSTYTSAYLAPAFVIG